MLAELRFDTADFQLYGIGVVQGGRLQRVLGQAQAERVLAYERIIGVSHG